MCVYSAIIDNQYEDWHKRLTHPLEFDFPPTSPVVPVPPAKRELTQDEINRLLKLLEHAKQFDAATGQPDCDDAAKQEKLKELARELGYAGTIEFP